MQSVDEWSSIKSHRFVLRFNNYERDKTAVYKQVTNHLQGKDTNPISKVLRNILTALY